MKKFINEFKCTKNCEDCDAFEMNGKQQPLEKQENGAFLLQDNNIIYSCQFLETETKFTASNMRYNHIEATKLF